MKIYAKENLKIIIMKKGYNITNLASDIGITKQGFGQILNRRVGIQPKNAQKLAEILGELFDELFEFVERKSNKNG